MSVQRTQPRGAEEEDGKGRGANERTGPGRARVTLGTGTKVEIEGYKVDEVLTACR